MVLMQEEYLEAGIYSQYSNCQNIMGTLDSFSIKFIDFKNIQWENRTGDTFLKYQELELPQEVKDAWFETVGEQKDMQESDFYAQVSSGMRRRVKELLSGENRQADTWEESVSAALNAAKDALQDLEYNLVPELKKDADIQEEIRKQRAFYQAFIDKLNMLLEESTEVETTESISQESISVETDQKEFLTYEEMIAQKIEELFTKIENGEIAPSFQIANQERKNLNGRFLWKMRTIMTKSWSICSSLKDVIICDLDAMKISGMIS